ncbi:MAG: pseudouridine synthase [Fibrobacteraceae bacterium]|jgi:16S rRNA pseudouridine516 synthase|nr:pseudouridine synthase [Fibrobacteraceae bacterium]
MPTLTLERLLASIGFGSRKECRALIRMGLVELEGIVQEDPFVEFETRPYSITVNGEEVTTETKIYGILHKPLGYECSAKPQHHESVFSLLPSRFQGMGVRLVGRLDVDTSGLICFSNQGDFIHALESPKRGVKKRYLATLARPLEKEQEEQLLNPMMLKNEKRPVQAKSLNRLEEKVVEIEITEGLYHQVRRMFAAVGNHVESLKRISIGNLDLEQTELLPGEWRLCEAEDLKKLDG